MRNICSHRSVEILALLVFMLSGCAVQLFATNCDQPRVSFQSPGELTIFSQGCSVQQVLTAVGRQTALEFQIPASASTVPVFAKLGPGDPTQVLDTLLAGTPFNWSLTTDGAVVLTERSALQARSGFSGPFGAGCVSCPVPPGVDPRGDPPPRPPLCTSEFTKGNRDVMKVFCIWDTERIGPNNGIR